jgi:hypothetical protein
MDAVKRRKLDVSEHELQLCDAFFVILAVEEIDGCVQFLCPVGWVGEVGHVDRK